MRASFFNRYDSLNDTSFQAISINFTGPLILHADPVDALHASTKRYVDNLFGGNLNASVIDSGVVSVSTLPGFSGDVTAPLGSNVFTLADTGVSVGNHNKVTVNAKGLITAGEGLSVEDIPDFSWSKITSGKPTTLLGYGIDNAVRSTGDSLIGTLKVTGTPSSDQHAATKLYVDSKALTINEGEEVGTIIKRASSLTVNGFLRCNGAELDKETYGSLYAVVGEKYTYDHGTFGNGEPWTKQYGFNQTGNAIGSWAVGAAVPLPLFECSGFMVGDKLYITGGVYFDGANFIGRASVYVTTVNSNGSITAWTSVPASALPVSLYNHKHLVVRDKVYMFGGGTYPSSGNNLKIYSAKIKPDYTLEPWVVEEITLGYSVSELFIIKQKLYACCAEGIFCSDLKENGDLGVFYKVSDFSCRESKSIVTDNKLHLILSYRNSAYTNEIYSANIYGDGSLGEFKVTSNTPYLRIGTSVVTTKNRVWILGGAYENTYTGDVQSAPINADGTLGAWVVGTAMPLAFYGGFTAIIPSGVLAICGSNQGQYNTNMCIASLAGGLNNYSSYYDGTITVTAPDKFCLPNFDSKETDNLKYYIKY